MRIVECVPNFSEGRDRSVLDAIAESVRSVAGVRLLDIDPGESTNRTVFTFVGEPDVVLEAAFQAAATACRLIDMSKHTGEHPRLGAVDVVPFVPVSGVTMAECVELSRRFGKRVADELGVPVYLYEEAQPDERRKALRDIRAGEYEGLPSKIAKPEWQPDFGAAKFNARSGATVTGARFFLIAYNVNILGTHNQAHRLALNVREQGRPDQPGRFKALKGLGWELEQYGLAQVSMNVDNYRITPLHEVYEAIKHDAREINVGVAGSEIVGLVPREAILAAAEYYIAQENLFILDERQKVRLAVDRLGLSSLHEFNPDEKIIEYLIAEDDDGPLIRKSVREFVAAVGSRTPAPGGGSASALMASMGAALGAMVGWLTYGRRKYEHLDPVVRQHLPALVEAQENLLHDVDRDTNAYNDYMLALQMPKGDDAEKKARSAALQEGLKKATRVPFETMTHVDAAWDALVQLAKVGQFSSRSDLEVGAKGLEAGLYGAYRNVLINLHGIKDEEFRREMTSKASELWQRGSAKFAEIQAIVDARTGDV